MIIAKDLLYKYLIEDAKHAGVSFYHPSIRRKVFDKLTPNYSFRYIKLLRTKEFYANQKSYIAKLLCKYYEIKLHKLGTRIGFYIPKDVFGPGLYIPHTGSVMVSSNSKIGANCQINNNVVIGPNKDKAPKIGDNVFIGPGAVISGDIYIADNVWIGANAVVTKSITEPYVLVAGVPACIVAKRKSNWVDEFFKK